MEEEEFADCVGKPVPVGDGEGEGVPKSDAVGEGSPLPSQVPRIATLSTLIVLAEKLYGVSAQQKPVAERSASEGKFTWNVENSGAVFKRVELSPNVVKARVVLVAQGFAAVAFAVE